MTRFECVGLIEDLDQAVLMYERAIVSTSNRNLSNPMYLYNLADSLQIRFERTKVMNDLERVITMSERAVASTTNDPSYAKYLDNLSSTLQTKFQWSESMNV